MITPECFNKSFVLVNDNITKYIKYKYEWCKHTKTKSCYKNIDVDSLVVWFSSFFLWFDVFHPTNLMDLIFKKFDQTKMFQILLYTSPNLNLIQQIWSN